MSNWSVDFDSVEAVENNLIPSGQYRIALEKVTVESVKNGINAGKPQANCQFTITDDRQHGRKVFQYFAPHVGFQVGMLKALAIATNTPQIPNMLNLLNSLIGKEFLATIGVRKNDDPSYPDSNVINGIKPLPVQQYQQQHQQYKPTHTNAPHPVYNPPVQPIKPAHLPPDAITQDNGVSWWVLRDGTYQQVA